MKDSQPGFFDYEHRLQQIEKKDSLGMLSTTINWVRFRPVLNNAFLKEAKGPGGRPPFDYVLMFKVLILQRLYHLSDAQTEYLLRDRLSFMRFVGADLHGALPDEKTIWHFRQKLIDARILQKLWDILEEEIRSHGIELSDGAIIDASIVPSSTGKPPRSKKDENKDDNSRESEEEHTSLSEASKRQRDYDAKATVKRNTHYWGYKNHIKIDKGTKLITRAVVTPANDHDSTQLPQLLDSTDRGKEIYADKGYSGMNCLSAVVNRKAVPRILFKAYRNKPVSSQQKDKNRIWSKTRARVEHIFGHMKTSMKFESLRCVGKARAEFTIMAQNMAYNLQRLCYLKRTMA